jgi:hypothetical protein
LHVIWDDSPSVETRNNLVQKIDAFDHRTFPSKSERFGTTPLVSMAESPEARFGALAPTSNQ